MAGVLNVSVGVHHGPGCTCKPLDEITRTVTVQPVIVNRGCPGQREIPRTDEITGRVIITWPARKHEHTTLPVWGVSIHDADSGEQITTALGLRMVIGTKRGWDGPIEVELEQLTNAGGKPLATGAPIVPDEAGDGYRTAVFRYVVAEMRVAEA